jgi:hypothetical protein
MPANLCTVNSVTQGFDHTLLLEEALSTPCDSKKHHGLDCMEDVCR